MRPVRISHLLEAWQKLASELTAGRSVIFYSPRNYRDRRCAEEILADFKSKSGVNVVHFYIDHHVAGGKLDYTLLWQSTVRKAKVGNRKRIQGRDDFYSAIRHLVETSSSSFLFFISSSGAGFETYQFDVISLLHQVREELDVESSSRILLFTLDNYPLYYYENTRTEHSSVWNLTRIHHWALEESDLSSLFKAEVLSPWIDPAFADNAAHSVFNATGGHVGLLVDLFDKLVTFSTPVPPRFWEIDCLQLLRHSAVLEDIRRLLSEDPVGLSEVALSYKQRRFPNDESPNVQFLRHTGVVHWRSALKAELCPGLVSELVVELRDSHTRENKGNERIVGTLVTEFGPRLFDMRAEKALVEDADFVVVHLSDLHAGDSFPFRYPRFESNKKSLADILTADLLSMGLIGKLDAVVLSGDFTETASMDEFRRARDVVEEILNKMGLSSGRLVVTAGNHDVTWNPNKLSHVLPASGVSRDNYVTFKELLRLPSHPTVELMVIASKSGDSLLRLLSLDSNFVEGPHAAGIGFVSQEALDKAECLLNDEETKRGQSTVETVRTWVIVHHHVFPASSLTVDDVMRPKLTVLANASDVLAFCARVGGEMILHGHEHQPSITVARRWPSDVGPNFRPIVSVGAGSISASRSNLGPFSRNQYFVLFRMKDHVVIRSRSISDNGLTFVPHNDLVVPLN
jgi:hypothetical protein